MPNYQDTFETVQFSHTTAVAGLYAEDLGYFVFSLGVTNGTAAAIQVYPSKYSDDFITLAANEYKEIAVTTNYFRVEYTGTGETITVDVVRSPALEGLLAPLYPNLYAPDIDVEGSPEDFKINPINAYGYTFTPWVTSDLSQQISDNSTLVELDYYVNGQVVSYANSTNFYSELFNMMLTQIQGFQPAGYVPPYNPEYSPTTAVDIVEKVRGLYENINDTYYEEEFLFGYAALDSYDEDLRTAVFRLDSATDFDRVVLPFTALAFTVKAIGAGATLDYYTKGNSGSPTTVTLGAADATESVVGNGQYFIATSGEVELTFTGQRIKMMEFAPIINVVYPLGMTQTEGIPAEDFATFAQAITDFKQHLEDNKFTGRVIYFRSHTFDADASPVWNAGKWVLDQGIKPIPYVWNQIQQYVPNYHAYSRLEKDLLGPIVYENKSYYYDNDGELVVPLPETLEEVISDANVSIRGLTTEASKKEFLVNMLVAEYVGQYSLGGAWMQTVGVGNNRLN